MSFRSEIRRILGVLNVYKGFALIKLVGFNLARYVEAIDFVETTENTQDYQKNMGVDSCVWDVSHYGGWT